MLKPITQKEAIQLEITNACVYSCSNCTRLVGHHQKPYMMDLDYFRCAVDNIIDTPTLIGIMGGEPMLHPYFKDICLYLQNRITPDKLAIWSTFDKRFKKYARLICDTFAIVLPNDHSYENILHTPILVSSQNVLGHLYRKAVDNCWVQQSWSASITSRGAYFCEVAAAIDMLLDTGTAFDIKTKWWRKAPAAYEKQVNALCSQCGVCLNLTARRDSDSVDDLDDIWLKRLAKISPKVKAKCFRIFNGRIFDPANFAVNSFRNDTRYFQRIVKPFGLKLLQQKSGYLKPVLI